MGVSFRFGGRSGSSRGTGSKVGATLFFGIFLLMGLLFTGLFVWDAVRTIRSWTWPTVR